MPFEPDRLYPPTAPELRVIGAVQTLNRWRCEGRGPAFIKCGARVRYRGQDLLDWLEAHRVESPDAK